jgi:hypothetical protein
LRNLVVKVSATPEPGSMVLLGAGLIAVSLFGGKRKLLA